MSEIKEIQTDVFQACLWVFFGSEDECAEALRKRGNVEEMHIQSWLDAAREKGHTYGMYTYHEDADISLLWMREVPSTILGFGTLVHEIEHYVFYLFQRIGMKHTEDSDEAYAYMLGYIYQKIEEIISSYNF